MQQHSTHNVSPGIRGILMLAFFAAACTSTTAPPMSVMLSGPIAYGLFPGESRPLAAQITDNLGHAVAGVRVEWTVADTSIAQIVRTSPTSATLVARRGGRTSLTLTVADTRYVASQWVSLVTVQ